MPGVIGEDAPLISSRPLMHKAGPYTRAEGSLAESQLCTQQRPLSKCPLVVVMYGRILFFSFVKLQCRLGCQQIDTSNQLLAYWGGHVLLHTGMDSKRCLNCIGVVVLTHTTTLQTQARIGILSPQVLRAAGESATNHALVRAKTGLVATQIQHRSG